MRHLHGKQLEEYIFPRLGCLIVYKSFTREHFSGVMYYVDGVAYLHIIMPSDTNLILMLG